MGFIVGIVFEWKSKKYEILRSEKRLLFYIVGAILWFFIMFGDEIIGMYQLKKLCESEKIFLIKDVIKLSNKNLILEFDSKNRGNVRYSAIPIKYNISKYLDASNQSEIFTYKNVFIVSASAVNYRHEQKNLPKRYQSRAICASPSPAGKCP